MAQRLGDRHVRVGQLDVLAHQRDLELWLGALDQLDELAPGAEIGRVRLLFEPEFAHDQLVQATVVELKRDLVDRLGRWRRNDRLDGDVAEEGDLLAQLVGHFLIGPGDDDVGLDADSAQLLDRVLSRLRLQLASRRESRQQRHVDVEHVAAADVLAHLANGLEERQRLDVAHRAAHLDDDHVGLAVAGDASDALLDLVGDVRDDLNGPAQVVAAALLGDDRLVDAAGGDVRQLGQALVDEALVVAQVEVSLGAVVSDEHLAVLVGAHRARIDVDVGIELDDADGETAALEQPADAGGGDAFAE